LSRFSEIALIALKRVRAFLFSWDALTFLCFVLVATALWYGHALGSMREMTLHIPVVYEGVPNDVYFEPELPDVVDVTIRDAGRRLITQNEELPTLTFNLSDQIKGAKGKIHISSEQIYQKLPTTLQGSGTAKVRSIAPESIESEYKERFNERKYTLPVGTKKVPSGSKLLLFPAEVEVVANVSQSHYNDISAKDISVYCDYPTEGEDKLKVKFINRSKFIRSIRIQPAEVEYIIEK